VAAYHFIALDASGRQKKGVDQGDTARQIRQQLRAKGWTPLEVHEVLEKSRGAKRSSDGEKKLALFQMNGVAI